MCQNNSLIDRQCVICNRKLYGRSDKRFCDINCKNYYHSEVRKSMKTIKSQTLAILMHNYVALSGILGGKKNACIIDKLAMEKAGFRFNYITDAENRHGIIYYGVFDITYRFIHNKRVLITVDKQRSKVSPYIFKRWDRELKETLSAIR